MANKRPAASEFKFIQPKMQKLDIINVRSPSKDFRNMQKPTFNFSYNSQPKADDLWDDDDDAIILFASQQIENNIAANNMLIAATGDNDTSFATFSRGQKMATSTQAIQSAPNRLLNDYDFGDGFDKDFDDILDSKPTEPKSSTSKSSMVKPAAQPQPSTSTVSTANLKSFAINPNANRAKDLQIGYMTTNLEQKRDNEHLKEKLNVLTKTVQTKDGEVAIEKHRKNCFKVLLHL